MAHNINFNEQTGKHSFFSVREKAWIGTDSRRLSKQQRSIAICRA